MNKLRFTWVHSIFTRLLTILFLIMIPLYAAGMFIYNWGIQTVREEISNSMQSKVDYYLNSIENEIQRIQILQYDALADENLYMLATVPKSMNEYEKAKAMLRLQQRLNAIKNSSIYIKSITAYIPSLAKTIASDAIAAADAYPLLSSPVAADTRINYWDGALILIARYPLPYQTEDRTSQYMIEIELSMKELENALAQLNAYEGSGSLLHSPQGRYTISPNAEDAGFAEIFLAAAQSKTDQDGESAGDSIQVNGKSYLIIQSASNSFNLQLISYIPEIQIFKQLQQYKFWLWFFTFIVMMIIVIFSASIYKIIHQPLLRLIKSFRKVELGNLDISIDHHRNDEFRYLYTRFNAMAKNLNTLIDQLYKQKILAQRAELKQLQSQINPHFLYNNFFILYNMVVTEDYENVAVFTKQLGKYFEYITRSGSDEVPLEKEVAQSRIYADIQGKRYRNRIAVEFAPLPEQAAAAIVPRLIIQPVLENAFEHGLKNKLSDGLVRIRFELKGHRVLIVVEDNGDETTDAGIDRLQQLLSAPGNDAESTGMINIHRRVSIKFGEDCGVTISRGELGGLRVEIKINLTHERSQGGGADV